MDRNYIEREHIVDRYLAGELTVREARDFEKYCLEHPEILSELPIPVRLKARLARRPLDTSETGMFHAIPSSATHAALQAHEEGLDLDDEPYEGARAYAREGVSRVVVYLLGAGLLAAIGGAGFYAYHANELEARVQDLQQEARVTQMQAPGSAQTLLVEPVRTKPVNPTVDIGWANPPRWLDLRINMSEGKINQFQLTIDRADGTRVMQIRRMNRDSNRELRLALNTSAFGPGNYLMRIDAYNWRGQTQEVGWLMLGVQ